MKEIIKPTIHNGQASLRVWYDPNIEMLVIDVYEPDNGGDATLALTPLESEALATALKVLVEIS